MSDETISQPLSKFVEARLYIDNHFVELADRNNTFILIKDEFEALMVFAKKIGWLK